MGSGSVSMSSMLKQVGWVSRPAPPCHPRVEHVKVTRGGGQDSSR